MNTYADKTQENKSQSVANEFSQKAIGSESTFQFVDNRPEAIAQRKFQEIANNSPQVMQLRALQTMANNSPQAKQAAQLQIMADNYSMRQQQPIQKKENNTGLTDNLKSGIENLSGYSMDDVKVHRNSDKPAQLQAHAYTQGTDIHLGSGQEKHLPHEAWHVVQQKQGRVKPTMQMKDKVNINDDAGLEKEADVMGSKALNLGDKSDGSVSIQRKSLSLPDQPVQRVPLAGDIINGAYLKNKSSGEDILQGYGLMEMEKGTEIHRGLDTKFPIQRYAESADGQYNISENQHFAVSKENYPNTLYTDDEAPANLDGGLEWKQDGTLNINDTDYIRYEADISTYDKKLKKALGITGSEQHCGAFAKGITNDASATSGSDRSTSAVGGVLKDSETSPGLDAGWNNHFAATVKVDGGDHATYETAVGIPHTWVGIYGINKGQTFRYKTQEANIDRLVAMEDIVLAGAGPRAKGFFDYLFCRSGEATDIIIHLGITEEEAETYRNEMTEWVDNGTQPTSSYMIRIVRRLEEELTLTGGQ